MDLNSNAYEIVGCLDHVRIHARTAFCRGLLLRGHLS